MSARDIMVRMTFALIIGFGMYVGLLILCALALIQFVTLPFTREMKPDQLGIRMGKSLSEWMFQASRFLVFASDEKPFPWNAWPHAD